VKPPPKADDRYYRLRWTGYLFLGPEDSYVHRVAVAVLAALLGAAPSTGVAQSPFDSVPASYDLSTQLMLQWFGEIDDAHSSLAAAYGDRTSESPLRDLALEDRSVPKPLPFAVGFAAGPAVSQSIAPDPSPFDVAAALRSRTARDTDRFALPSTPPDDGNAAVPETTMPSAVAAYTVGQYQPVAPVPAISPEPGAFAFGSAPRGGATAQPDGDVVAFGQGALPAGSTGSSGVVPSTMRVGPVQLRTRMEGAATDAPQLSLKDSGYGAGADFDVRAGARNLNVDLSSNYEHVSRADSTALAGPALGAASSWQLPDADTPLVIPNYADMSKLSIGAAVAVPVVHGLTLNLNYAADRLIGGYGLPGLTNLDATDNSYGGKLTFEMPHSASTLSISARALRYQDNILPANALQTREDVNFTVKF
jgi:hypothetical protein